MKSAPKTGPMPQNTATKYCGNILRKYITAVDHRPSKYRLDWYIQPSLTRTMRSHFKLITTPIFNLYSSVPPPPLRPLRPLRPFCPLRPLRPFCPLCPRGSSSKSLQLIYSHEAAGMDARKIWNFRPKERQFNIMPCNLFHGQLRIEIGSTIYISPTRKNAYWFLLILTDTRLYL